MAKDPAFLFYPNDWIGGTMGMTFEEKGAYVELLMLQFNRGHMTKHMIAQAVGQLWVKIEDKFRMDTDGLYYNARLDLEKEKRKNYSKSRRNNLLGKNQHTNKVAHMTSHMENENNNTINIGIAPEMFKIFKNHNSKYFHDKEKDFSACLSMAYKIAEIKGWDKKEVLDVKKNDVLSSWEKIVVFCAADKWFSTRALFDLNNEWQRVIQSMNGKFSGDQPKKEVFSPIQKESETNFDKYRKKKPSAV